MAQTQYAKGEASGIRRITCLTPNTFTRPIVVISTLIQTESGKGQTAICKVETLNSKTIAFNELSWKIVKDHESEAEAFAFHEKLAKETDLWAD